MAAVETFDLVPEFQYVTRRESRVVRTNPSDGAVQRRAVWPQPNPLRTFRLVWKFASDATVARLRGLYDSARGGAATLTYTPVGDVSSVPVRFGGNSLLLRRLSVAFWSVELTLLEERI